MIHFCFKNMRFPKAELDLCEYRKDIRNLLSSEDCHLFIDTNIISQLYKLNDKAREDFFDWVSSVSSRFHIPAWVVHEYQKRYVSQKTKEYLSELENDDVVKRLNSLSLFAKGFVSDSLLVGSIYQDKKDELFQDLENVAKTFEKIHKAITKRLTEHQLNVHSDMLKNLGKYSLNTDIYSILNSIALDGITRYNHLVPPGFEDSGKDSNCYGDLIIWREILHYCKENKVSKAIWITKDLKPDMVYTPQRQIVNKTPSKNKKAIAHEGLVFEFLGKTGSEDFYIIDFLTLAECLADRYQTLATSFQIVTTPEQKVDREGDKAERDNEEKTCELVADEEMIIPHQQVIDVELPSVSKYSEKALADKDCESWCDNPEMHHIIVGLKSHNWYVQNDVIGYLIENQKEIVQSCNSDLDVLFVLGRNIYQSAVGSAFGAISFLDSLSTRLPDWDIKSKQALVDGMLYEVFFDSSGSIRPKGFKASFFETLLREIDLMPLDNPYDFINSCLKDQSEVRFVPEVHTDKIYSFEFECESINDKGDAVIKSLLINKKDASNTFTKEYLYADFAGIEDLITKLSFYYAIPEDKIKIAKLDKKVKTIYYIGASFDL